MSYPVALAANSPIQSKKLAYIREGGGSEKRRGCVQPLLFIAITNTAMKSHTADEDICGHHVLVRSIHGLLVLGRHYATDH